MVVAVDLAFEFAKLGALVHEALRDDRSAVEANDVAIFGVQHEIGLVVVAAGAALFDLVNVVDGRGFGRGQVVFVVVVAVLHALAENDRVVDALADAGEFRLRQIAGQQVLDAAGSGPQNVGLDRVGDGPVQRGGDGVQLQDGDVRRGVSAAISSCRRRRQILAQLIGESGRDRLLEEGFGVVAAGGGRTEAQSRHAVQKATHRKDGEFATVRFGNVILVFVPERRGVRQSSSSLAAVDDC